LLEKNDPAVTMSGLSAPDDTTVIAKLTSAAGWFESAIAQPSAAGMIVDRQVVKTNFDGWWSKPETLVGTGAFKMSARAANLSLDRAKLAKDVCSDVTCVPATGGVIPKGLLGYLGDSSDPLAAFDPVRARTLLLAADPNGAKSKDLTYTYDPENAFNEPVAKFLQSQWLTNLGVTVKLQAVPHTRFITERLKGLYVLSRDGWAADYNH